MTRLDTFGQAHRAIEAIAKRDPDPVVQQEALDIIEALDENRQEALLARAVPVLTDIGAVTAVRLKALSVVRDVLLKGV